MRYVTTLERNAIQQGLEQGLEQGQAQTLRENIVLLLTERFHHLPSMMAQRLTQIRDIGTLRPLFRRAITVESLAAFNTLVEETLGQDE